MEAENYFDALPIELLQQIACHIESVVDLLSYSRACRATHDAIEEDDMTFWRKQFLSVFDWPAWKPLSSREETNRRFRAQYLMRMHIIQNPVDIRHAGSPAGQRQTKLLLELIVQSFTTSPGGQDVPGKNMVIIKTLAESSTTQLSQPFWHLGTRKIAEQQKYHPLLMGQCLLLPSMLRRGPVMDEHGRILMKSVYDYQSCLATCFNVRHPEPLFQGYGKLNFQAILQVLNFWKQWLVADPLSAVAAAFSALPCDQLPQYWGQALADNTTLLPRCWNGASAVSSVAWHLEAEAAFHSESMEVLFSGGIDPDSESFDLDRLCLDWFDGENQEYLEGWKADLESTGLANDFARAMKETEKDVHVKLLAFRGELEQQADPNHGKQSVKGWVSTLPKQYGVPGWKKFIMVATRSYNGEIISRFAHHGIVMPGNKIIVGHRCEAINNEAMGPFIFWA